MKKRLNLRQRIYATLAGVMGITLFGGLVMVWYTYCVESVIVNPCIGYGNKRGILPLKSNNVWSLMPPLVDLNREKAFLAWLQDSRPYREDYLGRSVEQMPCKGIDQNK